jgi:hypothetical protein
MCRGEILAWLRMISGHGGVRAAVACLEQSPDVDVVYGDCGIIDREGKRVQLPPSGMGSAVRRALRPCSYQAASFMRRSILEGRIALAPTLS